jgi:hypothetical protein
MLLDPVSTRRHFREKMSETMYRHAMSVAFKNWHTLALAAVLYAVNVYLLSIGNRMISTSSQSIGGWVVLVVSGYLFIGAIYLVSSTLTENSTLSESFPGVIDQFRTFIVGAIAYAIGYFLLFNVAPPLQTTQALAAAVTLIVGGAIYLVAILVGVAAAFVRPRK